MGTCATSARHRDGYKGLLATSLTFVKSAYGSYSTSHEHTAEHKRKQGGGGLCSVEYAQIGDSLV